MKKIICRLFIVLLVILVVFIFVQKHSNHPKQIISKLNLTEKNEYNSLKYKVKFFGVFPVADAEINFAGEESLDGKNVYHISAVADTLEVIKPFFTAQARVDSYIDKEKVNTVKFVESTKIKGKEDKEKTILYDQKRNVMLRKGEERVIKPNTQDPLSAIFYIRNQEFEVGKKFDLYFNTNQTNYLMSTRVLAKDTYALADEDVSVWAVSAQIRRDDGSPYHQTNLKFYLLGNKSKTLLLIKVFSGVGIISVPLVEAK